MGCFCPNHHTLKTVICSFPQFVYESQLYQFIDVSRWLEFHGQLLDYEWLSHLYQLHLHFSATSSHIFLRCGYILVKSVVHIKISKQSLRMTCVLLLACDSKSTTLLHLDIPGSTRVRVLFTCCGDLKSQYQRRWAWNCNLNCVYC